MKKQKKLKKIQKNGLTKSLNYDIVLSEREVNKMNIKEIKEYYESEYKSIKNFLQNTPGWADEKETINNALQRLLGVAQYSQYCGISYKEIDKLYTQYRIKFEELKRKYV